MVIIQNMDLLPQELFQDSGYPLTRFVEDAGYATNFGGQWHMFPKTQLDSYSGLNISEVRLKRCLGEDLWTNLKNKTVLEVGAGAGRFTEILLKQGAKVISVDMSSAVEVNAANFVPDNHHTVLQADVMSLPFRRAQFDVVVCLGVIQHTPVPERTIDKLAQQVRPGGWLVIDHYRFTPASLSMRMIYRPILKRMSHQTAFRVVNGCGKLLLPLHRWCRNIKPLSLLLNRFSPMITYYSAFPQLDDEQQKDWALLDTFDGLTDWYKHFRSQKQIQRTLENLKFGHISVTEGGNGIEARAQKSSL